MKRALTLIFILSQFHCFSQLAKLDGWKEDGLFSKPSKVVTSKFETVEKFGELTDNLVELGEKMYNENGYCLTIHFESYKSPKKEDTKYYYDNSSGHLTRKEFGNNELYKYAVTYDYTDQNITQINYQYLGRLFNETVKEVLGYDADNNNIEVKSYNKNNSLLNIWQYNYVDKKISEVKQYSGDGFLLANTKYQYNPKGLLIRKDDSSRNSRNIKSIEYNDRNDSIKVIRTFTISSGSNQSTSEIIQYKYEYYPSGEIKKISCYYRDQKNQKDTLYRIIEYMSYDASGNWIEKTISEQNYTLNKFMQRYKYFRKISYF